MVAIPYPLSSSPGAAPGEGQGRLVNCYASKDGQQVSWYRVPGLTAFADMGRSTPRGMLSTGTELYVALEDKLLKVGVSGGATVTTLSGDLSGLLPVTMARNNRAPTPDIAVVSENGAFYTTGASVAAWPDPDLGSPNSVDFLNGYFVFGFGDGSIVASELNSTDVNALSTRKAEAKPDGILRVLVSGQQVYEFGSETLEIESDRGTSPYPFGRDAVIPVGLIGQWAVAGAQSGWDLPLIFVASDATVRMMEGYQPRKISTRDVERAIEDTPDKSLLRAMVYTTGSDAFWALSSPDWTWEYNAATSQWHERRSYGQGRWRAEVSCKAFDGWIVGDMLSTQIMRIDDANQTEDGEPLVARAEGFLKDFPNRFSVPAVHLDFTTGQGDGGSSNTYESDPQVQVSWSFDGGGHWSNPVFRDLGVQGRYAETVRVNRIGRTTQHGLKLAFEISDPTYFSFRGASVPGPLPRRP